MDKIHFDYLLERLYPYKATHYHQGKYQTQRPMLLILTIRRKWRNLSFLIILTSNQQAIHSKDIRRVAEAIIEELQDVYLKTPNTVSKRLEMSEKFSQRWNFPNTIGAIDGKHIVLK